MGNLDQSPYKDNLGIMERTMETTTGFRVRGASIDSLQRMAQGSLCRAVLLNKKFHLTRTTQNLLPLGNLSERRLLNTVGLLPSYRTLGTDAPL